MASKGVENAANDSLSDWDDCDIELVSSQLTDNRSTAVSPNKAGSGKCVYFRWIYKLIGL